MDRLELLVSPDGQWLSADSAEFRSALGDPDPDYDAPLFAVKNLGFIRFQMLDQSIIEIELHPRNVELPALLAVQQQLLSSRVRLFRIKYLENSWKSEITSSTEHAISRLSELCTPRTPPPASDKFVVEPQDYAKLLDNHEHPLRPMAQKWRASFGYFDPSVISFAIKHELLSRMMIAGIKPREADPVFRFIGGGHTWLDTSYQVNAIGERMENMPDKDYGGWVSEFYKSVASTGQPRYDIVRAAIQVSPTRKKVFTTRYERLLLPWRTPSSEIFVTLFGRNVAEPEEESLGNGDDKNPVVSASVKSA